MTNYKEHLKRVTIDPSIRWFVKTDSKGKIKEVKQVYDPQEYLKGSNPRKLLNKEELISFLESNL